MTSEKRMCARCVMDTSDPAISFDAEGVCNHCRRFDQEILGKKWLPGGGGEARLNALIAEIKKQGRGREYDAILGLSGGLDSSYLAWVAAQHGLRMLAVNVDTGWNSEAATHNVASLAERLGLELLVIRVDWNEMRDLQLAYLRSGVLNQDVPQDHAFVAALFQCADKRDIHFIISGSNLASESVLPKSWVHNALDLANLKDIHRQFGTTRLKSYPTISFFQYYVYYPFIRKIRMVKPLNYLTYTRTNALETLEREIGWVDYGGKHQESLFTSFYQQYLLPTKYGIDKRRAHLSSLILSGQMTRSEALSILHETPDRNRLHEICAAVSSRLGLTPSEFQDILSSPIRPHSDFRSDQSLFRLKDIVRMLIKR